MLPSIAVLVSASWSFSAPAYSEYGCGTESALFRRYVDLNIIDKEYYNARSKFETGYFGMT